MNEAQFTSKWMRWGFHNWQLTAKLEVKMTKGLSIPFSVIVPHQRHNLANKRFFYKIPDLGVQNPFDIVAMIDEPGYVILYYYTRGKKEFYIVNIKDVLEYEKSSFETLFSSEIPKALQELISMENVLLSPHIAGWTAESKEKLAQVIVDKIKASIK